MSVKEKYPDVSTSRGQRIAIWVICIVMAVGFLAGLFVWVLAIVNPATDPSQIAQEKAIEEMTKQMEAESAAETENAMRYVMFGGHELTTFDPESVTELSVEVLQEGTGAVIAGDSTISAYYTGWTPTGTIFDSTQSIDSANEARTFSLEGVITGWTQGLSGQKVGGVYKLTIPSAMAYGEYGMGTIIPPNTPLRFIVEVTAAE